MHLDHVAGGAGERRHDRSVPPRQPVQQCRLTGVRRSRDGNNQSFPQTLATPAISERITDLTAQLLRSIKRGSHQILGYVSLVGKVDAGLDQRQRFNNLPAPSLRTVANQALELAERMAALGWRFRGDQ